MLKNKLKPKQQLLLLKQLDVLLSNSPDASATLDITFTTVINTLIQAPITFLLSLKCLKSNILPIIFQLDRMVLNVLNLKLGLHNRSNASVLLKDIENLDFMKKYKNMKNEL